MQGWIKLSRQILEWEWYKDINTKIVFIHLLLSVNIKDTKYMGFNIKRGSKAIKLKELSNELALTENEVRTALKHLKKTGEIETKRTNKFTLVSIVNYSKYQDSEKEVTNKTQTDNKQNTNKSQTINKPLTSVEEESKEGEEEKEINNNPPYPLLGKGSMSDKKNTAESLNGVSHSLTNESSESLEVETASDKEPNNEKETAKKTRRRKDRGILTAEQQELFNQFWEAYPNKKSIGQAEKTWKKLNIDRECLNKILLGIEQAKKHDSRFKDVQYTPYPSSWLNSKGWNDSFNYKPEFSKEAEANEKNRFINFSQREWDFDKLKRLERQRMYKNLEETENNNPTETAGR